MSTAEHKKFMEEAIAANPDVTWKTVIFHHSVYSTASHTDDSDILQRREELPPVLDELGIDVVLMGHDHVYTRTYMMNGTTPDTSAGVQSEVTNPEGVLYLTANSASGSKYYDIKAAEAPFSAVMDQSYRRTVTDIDITDTSYTMTTYYADDMTVVDKFTINKTEDTDNGGNQGNNGDQDNSGDQDNNGNQGGAANPDNGGDNGTSGTPVNDSTSVNSGSKNAVAQIISHELTHSIETSSSYGELSGLVFDRLKATGEDINALRTAKREMYERNGVTLADETAIDQEIVAEYVEKNLLTDEKSIRELVTRKRSLAKRISDWIDSVLAKLGNRDAGERAFLNRAKRLYAKALRETEVDNRTAKSDADIQFSLKNKNLDVNSRIPFTYLNDYISVSKGDNASLSKLETAVKGIKRGTYTNKATGYKADINSETINKALHPKSGKMNNFSTRYIDNLNAMRVLPEL